MRSVAPLPSCFLFLFMSISLRAAFPLQTPAPKAAATARNESRSADRNSCTLPAQSIIPGGPVTTLESSMISHFRSASWVTRSLPTASIWKAK